ncbi:hypothetical protein ABXS71_12225 [Bacillus infantis]|uniref:hypothetical protein n=1 Tax=Bacillus infantis TaxID=324767 RepID=UPI00344EAE0A
MKPGELYIMKGSGGNYSLVRLAKGIYMGSKKMKNLITEDYYVDFQCLSPVEQKNQVQSLEADIFFNNGIHVSPEVSCVECGQQIAAAENGVCTRCGRLYCQAHRCSCQ